MKIASSEVEMRSNRFFEESDETDEREIRTAFASGRVRGRPVGSDEESPGVGGVMDRVAISEEARERYQGRYSASVAGKSQVRSVDGDDVKVMRITAGRQKSYGGVIAGRSSQAYARLVPGADGAAPRSGSGDLRGWEGEGVSLHRTVTSRHRESEQLEFDARGAVTTMDGREIDFSLTMEMGREFSSETVIESDYERRREAIDLTDPLVINFSGKAPELTEKKFRFDLDSDGQKENISFLTPGSGFLALDENGDGVVNDGTELFGPQTGNGFGELAGYDGDGNGWIDENDAVYDRLSVWTQDGDGAGRLASLAEAGVGAIHLGYAQGAFDLKDSENRTQGRVRGTGIYLQEDGGVRSIQQVDLAAEKTGGAEETLASQKIQGWRDSGRSSKASNFNRKMVEKNAINASSADLRNPFDDWIDNLLEQLEAMKGKLNGRGRGR